MKKKMFRVRAAYVTKQEGEDNLQKMVQIAEKRVELITLGNSSVGKTQLLSRFANNTFENASESTIGVDFYYRNVKVESDSKSFEMLVKCWDTAGQECFKFAMKQYFRGRQGCLFVFSIDDYESFKNLKGWIESLNESNPDVRPLSLSLYLSIYHTQMSGIFNYCRKQMRSR